MRDDRELLRRKLARLRKMATKMVDLDAVRVLQDIIAELEAELRKLEASDPC
jgi:hypothetical protein